MNIQKTTFPVETKGFSDIIDVTPEVKALLGESGVRNGIVTVFVPGSTAGMTTIEYEDGALEDLRDAIERLIPSDIPYRHDQRWGDGNGFSHVRAAFFKPGLTIPVVEGELLLGTWQQIILIDFDNRPRSREIIVQWIGA